MKIALITTPPSARSGIGDYTRHLLPYLREECDVAAFVEDGSEGEDYFGEPTRSVADLNPRDFDQVLYQLGNEQKHAFMAPLIRAVGGTVVQHDWVLFDLALAAHPGLRRGGLKGHALALREGGVEQARIYLRNWLERRNAKRAPIEEPEDAGDLPGTFLTGWHAAEASGRWTADRALLRLPGQGCRRVAVKVASEAGRRLELSCDGRGGADTLTWGRDGRDRLELALGGRDQPLLLLTTSGIRVSPEQRRHGDARRLGTFVGEVVWEDEAGEHTLDMTPPAARPILPVSLSRDRFRLPFNRSVVRFADAFLVHSRYVKGLILSERNSATPVGVVHHGAEQRWRDGDRRDARARLGLPAAWRDGFLVMSFGGVQPHKRIDKVLGGLALARERRDDVHLVLAGKIQADGFDPESTASMLGIRDAVHFAGFVSEELGWDLLHAGDVSVNLRGPTSGGTSGGIFQSYGLGRAVIASDAAEQRELPDACTVKIPLGAGEARALADEIVSLRDDPTRRDRLEAGARDFVRNECHWSVVAKRYAECLAQFPHARAARRSLVAVKLQAAARRRTAL